MRKILLFDKTTQPNGIGLMWIKWSKLMTIKQLHTWPTYVSQHWSCGFWVLKEIVWLTSESVRSWVRCSSNVTKPFLLICTPGMVKLSSFERVLVAKEVVELLAWWFTSESWNNKCPKSYFLTVHRCRCLHLLQHTHTDISYIFPSSS